MIEKINRPAGQEDRDWTAHWIGTGAVHVAWDYPSKPSPFFRRNFVPPDEIRHAEVFFCGLGWSELYLNGKKIGDRVLDPVVTQYDRRARYVRYDVTGLLRKGENVFGVILGNGWYDCSTSEVWHFDKAPWLDYPKFIFELVADGNPVLRSDESWKCLREDGPIRFNEVRNGEFYDAGRECPGWAESGFDDSKWNFAKIVPGPGGILVEQIMPPCKVMKRLPAFRLNSAIGGGTIYDLRQNITGWIHLKVKGAAGSEVRILYGERVSDNKDQLIRDNISMFIKSGECQTDSYTLKGDGVEEWEPRFTYHGFQYVETRITGEAEIIALEGCLVHTSFRSLTEFESSDPALNKLFECTRWSFVDNFTGIPTDCPHREKNGWMGDALMAAEAGLFNFDLASSYHDWVQTISDAQRPNGQLPGIAPTPGWGFNWGSGPAWDSAFILIPWYVWIYSGDNRIIRENYEKMKRYIRFLGTMATDHIVQFGLGDCCHVDSFRITAPTLTSTAYYYMDTVVMRKCAALLGFEQDEKMFSGLAARIQTAFNRKFYYGDGIYGKGEMTALACALYQGLCPEGEIGKVAGKLDELVRANRCRPDFGILGAKYVSRALADHGYVETAFRMISQPGFPGWMNWVDQGATTLWENWRGGSSLNHIFFGDVAAWMMQYLAGIVPDEANPGFSRITLRPMPSADLTEVHASYKAPSGLIKVDWTSKDGKFSLMVELPVPGKVILPDGSEHPVRAGKHRFESGTGRNHGRGHGTKRLGHYSGNQMLLRKVE